TVQATGLPSTLPVVFRATTPAAAQNSQRLAVPTPQRLATTVATRAVKSVLSVSTAATSAKLLAGDPVQDRVTITGASADWKQTVAVRVFGPFATASAIRCDGTPAWQGSFQGSGSKVYLTPAARLSKPGWYGFQEVVPGDAAHVGLT